MKIKRIALFLLLQSLAGLTYSQKSEIFYLSGTDADNRVEWEFFCTDGQNSGEWRTIHVPSNWEPEGFGTYNYGHDWRDESKKLGKEHGLYRHEFQIPREWRGRTINIVFDGSMTDTKVKINGKSAGEVHQGGFYRFKYDISKLLKYGQRNLLEVDVAKHSSNESVNRAERQADFWIFGGIFRPVFLEVLPKIHISRVAIDAKADGSFNALVVLSDTIDDYNISVELYELNGGKIEGRVHDDITERGTERMISGKFENTLSWNPERPYLYNMKISLMKGGALLHEVTERIGFRTIDLRKNDGFYVNGEKVVFKGVNRHSFWPETGRCLSEEHHLTDIRLIKEMNMNAVRMSHYIPDKRFLELCDSLGLFVVNEVTGWQDPYDTIVGPKLIKEAILKDENHPCVVIWNHGNERGWNFANEKWFHEYDIQKRPVLYPILLRNGIDTRHYPEYEFGVGRFVYGNDVFMATELLHGLYDGGLGAGLDEYWKSYQSSPLHAGGFLWVLADEAVLRTDMEEIFFDADGNHANDGILGPHREKEGSFYTVKEIWSPVQIKPVTINRQWNGKLYLENKFIYTDLKDCSFSWKAVRTSLGKDEEVTTGSGNINNLAGEPGETVRVELDCKSALQNADLFLFTAIDQFGRELYTWSWPVLQTWEKAEELIKSSSHTVDEIGLRETENTLIASAAGIALSFSKSDGTLISVKNNNREISFNGGPEPVGVNSDVTDVQWYTNNDGNFIVEISNGSNPEKTIWEFKKNGLLMLNANLSMSTADVEYIGISFNYPEEKCTGVKWMGRGPYRVWKNRIKGSNMGVWEKAYSNTVTGETFNNLIYPEFKGYYGNLYWLTMETTESDFMIVSETPNLYLQLFKPEQPKHVAGGTFPPFPEGDISFLYEIPAIGTKFKQAEMLGPKSGKGKLKWHTGDEIYPIKLWFDFRIK